VVVKPESREIFTPPDFEIAVSAVRLYDADDPGFSSVMGQWCVAVLTVIEGYLFVEGGAGSRGAMSGCLTSQRSTIEAKYCVIRADNL